MFYAFPCNGLTRLHLWMSLNLTVTEKLFVDMNTEVRISLLCCIFSLLPHTLKIPLSVLNLQRHTLAFSLMQLDVEILYHPSSMRWVEGDTSEFRVLW